MEDNIIGSIFFEGFGAFIKWIILAIFNKLRGRKIISYSDIFNNKKNHESEVLMSGVSNIILGILSFLGIGFVISLFYI